MTNDHRNRSPDGVDAGSPPRGHLLTLVDDALQRGDALDKIDRLLDLRDREERTRALRAFDAAIAAAKGEIPTIIKNRTVSYGTGKTAYKHADLAEIEKTVRPILAKYGLSYRFRSDVKDGKIVVTCMVSHKDGHREENSLPGPADTSGSKNPLQAIGSATTYLSRYTLMLSLGLAASDDDDAVAANGIREKFGTTPEDLRESKAPVEYGLDGEPIDNIPSGDPDIKPLPLKKDYRRPGGPFESLQKEMYLIQNASSLLKWGGDIRNEVARFQEDDQTIFRNLFKAHLESLRRKTAAVAEHIEADQRT